MIEEWGPDNPCLQCNPTDNKPSGTSITLLWRSTATPEGYLWRELQLPSFPYVAQEPGRAGWHANPSRASNFSTFTSSADVNRDDRHISNVAGLSTFAFQKA